MNKKIKLGLKIRKYRLDRRMNLKKLAELTDIAQSTLSKIENDVISPGFDKVMRVCQALEIDVTDLIHGEGTVSQSEKPPIARLSVTRKGETVNVDTANYVSNYVCSSISNKTMIPLISDLSIKEGEEHKGDPVKHPGEEFAYVLEGRVKVQLEYYEPVYLEEGDSIYFDSPMGHLYINAGEGNARILSVSLSAE